MQLYVITRGRLDDVNRYINDLIAQKYDRIHKGQTYKIAWQVRPIQLWEIAFPREILNEVLAAAQPYDFGQIPKSVLWSMKKLLKLKSIPRIIPNNFKVNKLSVQVSGIGIINDRIDEDGNEII